MPSRDALRQRFLQSSAWKNAELEAFGQDASFRQYFRLHEGPKAALLMDAPPDRESIQPFIDISQHLQKMGLSAPQIFHADTDSGFAIIEDFGDKTFTRLLIDNHDEKSLYLLATDCLLALHNHQQSTNIHHLPQREDTLLEEALLFCDWYYPKITGESCSKTTRQEFVTAWENTLAKLNGKNSVLVLRDFHVDNTMLLLNRSGVQQCGLLDFQDAAIGPAAYDLMSLLEDARRDVSPDVFSQCMARYIEKSHVIDSKESFTRDCAILAAQRHTRVAGVFVRLSKRDGKDLYLQHLPRITRLLNKNLKHPALGELNQWFSRYCPYL